uniref:Peroxisomal membrane protein PEX14 n=1 Tax=Wuchereria bancrofti TaxID=6293 RepID=A0A1I8EKW9_WUCBA
MSDDQKGKISDEKDATVIGYEAKSVEMVRPEMVDMARRFMMIPKIQQTPLLQQKQFLLQKGIREDEINEAMKGLPLQQDIWNINNTAMGHTVTSGISYDLSTKSSGVNTLLRLTKYAMIITGFSYAGWHLLRSYILPRFFNIPEPFDKRVHMIEEKMNEMQGMMQDVTTELLLKLQTVIDKQNITDRILFQSASQLDDIHKGIEKISAMLVSKEQLPLIRTLPRKRTAITSRIFLRTEDPSECTNSSHNGHSEETSGHSEEKSAPAEELDDSTQAEKNDSNCDS